MISPTLRKNLNSSTGTTRYFSSTFKIPRRDMTDYFITADELMRTLKVTSKTTFWRMRKRGDVPEPSIKKPLRWRSSDIESYYQERQNTNLLG
jgi:predicted DNA-binding transcriptional regulator AlpA